MYFSADQVAQQIDQCLIKDRTALRSLSQQIQRRQLAAKPVSKDIARLELLLGEAHQRVAERRELLPPIELVKDLPISTKSEEIAALLERHQVIVIAGETGSGKTTQIPKICLMSGRGVYGRIAHTQPRRVAARSVAQRIAHELGIPLGELVGYQVRFSDQSGPNTLLKLMTDGILLAEIQRDPELLAYDTIIVDEAHERSLNIDFLLGYLKNLLPRRPELKVIVTSATIDLQRFSEFFVDAPVLQVSGRTYPVEIEYLPVESAAEESLDQIESAVHWCLQHKSAPGDARDILIFLSGEREIRETAKRLRDMVIKGVEILPLYSRLSVADQDRVFRSGAGRRIVLATNVAETSITVPGIGYVIDPGLARISRFNARTQIQRLPVEAISQASANQRAGRSGRIAPGYCLRLYSEEDFLGRSQFTDPEILRTNLSAVILRMAALEFGDIRNFPFIEAPDSRQVNAGVRQLQELQLLDEQEKLTAIGRQVAQLPVDPKLARMLWEAKSRSCLREVLVIVAAMTVQDPRERPSEKRQQADQKHQPFQDKDSDFVFYLKLWDAWETARQDLTNRQLRSWCESNFLSFIRLREWREIHHQLRLMVHEQNWKENQNAASSQQLHEALLTGLLNQIGFRRDESEYLGPRNRSFRIFPGSALFKTRPKWVMAAEMIETSQLFAHQVAAIEPEWLENLAAHLIQTEYLEPSYSPQRGEVTARQRKTLFGLLIRDDQRVSYKDIDPGTCHRIFVREALALARYRGSAKFLQHNAAVAEELEEFQERVRRTDLGLTEEELYDFYIKQVDPSVVDQASFDQWYKATQSSQPKLLYLNREMLMQRAELNLRDQFPDSLVEQGISYGLTYQFDPKAQSDGVTLAISLESLQSFPAHLGEWLVPGMLEEKVEALLRSLPKRIRRLLLPISEKARLFVLQQPRGNGSLTENLATWLRKNTGSEVSAADFDLGGLPAYFFMNYALVGARSEVLEQSRDLSELKNRYRQHTEAAIESLSQQHNAEQKLSGWDFDALPEHRDFQHQGRDIRVWPGFEDNQTSVTLRDFSHPLDAIRTSRAGLARLYYLSNNQAVQYLGKELFKAKNILTLSLPHKNREALVDEVILTAISECFVIDLNKVRTKADFLQQLDLGRAALVKKAMDLEKSVLKMAETAREVHAGLTHLGGEYMEVKADIAEQMEDLLRPGGLFDTEPKWRRQIPRYLDAIQLRLQKLASRGIGPDQQAQSQVQFEWQRYLRLAEFQQKDSRHEWPDLVTYRWMIEEYRISLFAQPMKTLSPVSAKRLQGLISDMEITEKNFMVHSPR